MSFLRKLRNLFYRVIGPFRRLVRYAKQGLTLARGVLVVLTGAGIGTPAAIDKILRYIKDGLDLADEVPEQAEEFLRWALMLLGKLIHGQAATPEMEKALRGHSAASAKLDKIKVLKKQ